MIDHGDYELGEQIKTVAEWLGEDTPTNLNLGELDHLVNHWVSQKRFHELKLLLWILPNKVESLHTIKSKVLYYLEKDKNKE